jgi:hypothetical protein
MRNCLAVIGALVVLAAALIALGVTYMYFVPGGAPEEPEIISGPSLIQTVLPMPSPTPTLEPTPTAIPTPTPIPEPAQYRTRVLLRIRQYASGLNSFNDTNLKLQNDPGLINDRGWRLEAAATLDELVLSANKITEVDPVPVQYGYVHELLGLVSNETSRLRENYVTALNTGSMEYFEAAGDNLNQISILMVQVEAAMLAAGW